MAVGITSEDWRRLAEVTCWLHEATTWRELSANSPEILGHVIEAEFCVWNEVDHQVGLPHVELTSGYEDAVDSVFEEILHLLPSHPLMPADDSPVSQWREISQISDVRSQAEFEGSALYIDAFRHLDTRFQMIGQPYLGRDFTVLFSINRKYRDFDARDRELFRVLLNHYRVACRNLQQTDRLVSRLELLESYASERCGTIGFGDRGRVVEINDEARELIDDFFPEKSEIGFWEACRDLVNRLGPTCLSRISRIGSRESGIEFQLFGYFCDDPGGVRFRILIERAERNDRGPEHALLRSLTRRQQEVLNWIALGKSNAEISCILGISCRTVEKHCERIFEILGVNNRFSAASFLSRRAI